jgi:drug/metabolite transporter (DMT)-like permease
VVPPRPTTFPGSAGAARRADYRRGMLIMAASSVTFSAMSLLVPFAKAAGTYVLASARFVTGGVAILVMALFGLIKLRAVNLPWLLVRGAFGGVSVFLFYYGILKLGLGMGTVLSNTYPVFAALLAPILLHEKIKADVLAAVLVSFAGICLIVYPEGVLALFGAAGGSAAFTMGWDGLLALLGGFLASVAVVAIKKLRETDSSPVIYLAQCLFGALVFGYPTAASSFAFPPVIWIVLVAIGGLATVAQLIMTYAYKHVPTTEGSLLSFLMPVVNVVLGAAIFAETMHPLALVGSGVVLAACVYVALRDRIFGLPA